MTVICMLTDIDDYDDYEDICLLMLIDGELARN